MNKPCPLVLAFAIAFASCTNSNPPPPDQAHAVTRPGERTIRVDFEDGLPGNPPTSFRTGRTGAGHPGTWVLQKVAGAPSGNLVLAQTDVDATSSRYPLCVYEPLRMKDVRATVRFRPMQGEVDRAAGLIVRYHDEGEYYIARANALEGNVRLYKIVGGKRLQLASADAEVKSDAWQELGLEVVGSHFRVFYDGQLLFEADDSTLPDEGQVGLWTKADSVTWFDDLVIETPGQR